jgi:hypothetical protein
MRRKKSVDTEFVLFNVMYEDGTQSSNRKVPASDVGGFEGDEPAMAILAEQDRDIGEKSGRPRAAIKSISRSDR